MSKLSKRALLVGIDKYDSFGGLSGCAADVSALAPLLEYNDDGEKTRNFECRALTAPAESKRGVSRKAMISAINELFAPGVDVALFYFAGHGSGMPSDVCLCSTDGDYIEPGVPLSLLLGKAQGSGIKQVIIILDCCHAGGGGGNPVLGANVSALRDGVALFAASRHDQVAKELNGRGEFSTYLGAALEGGAADAQGKVTLASIYGYLAACFGSWEQRPTFKANLEDAYELRRTTPIIPLDSLRKLPEIFKTPTSALKLDPEYEREDESAKEEKVAIYDILTHYRNGRLIEFEGTPYLYHAAKKSKKTRLTPYGRHFWNLAKKKLL
jgi:hypothetical protein